MALRHVWLIAVLTLRCPAYELTGRIEPPTALPVFLHGATAPFESSTESGADGRFRFRKISAGTYTVVVSTPVSGQALQTIEVGPGTADSKGRIDIVLRIDEKRLESEGGRATSATVSATVLSIPERAAREYDEAQRCLSRREPERAAVHLSRAVQMAPQFSAAWNQLGVMAYQAHRYGDAETNFRRALDADPEAFEPLANLGGVLLNLARPKEALGYNQRAVARRPNNALVNSQLGLSYLDLNDPDMAEKYLLIAVQLDPAHFSHPQLALAEIYLRRGDQASALRQLSGFLEQHPDAPEAGAVRRRIAELSRAGQ
jgi:tetratricopeptide (TPR) repeat protein